MGCTRVTAAHELPSAAKPAIATITLGPDTGLRGVKRLGINLSGQSFYDSGQMMRNLVFRNPGFEGETWQSILHCKTVTATTCTDENQYTVWPTGFLDGAHYEVLSGTARGSSGTVTSSTAAHDATGVTLTLAGQQHGPAAGGFLLIRLGKPGHAEAGWWTSATGGAGFSTEFKDLAPNSPGRQALRVDAAGPGQDASVSSYFDSLEGHSFVQLHGPYTLRFRAKATGGGNAVAVRLERMDKVHGLHAFFSQTVPLTSAWHDYSFTFPTDEHGQAVGTVGLTFAFHGSSALLDDVSLTPAGRTAANPTEFRDEVVQTLRELRPGVLRYMDNGTDFGSSLDNMLAVPFARERSGASTQEAQRDDIPIGLQEFLTLCKAVDAEPWYAMPPGTSPAEAAHLIEYLAGPASTPYGARRAKLGQAAPWTDIFPTIHLELGNEEWNSRSFAGSSMADPAAYARRASEVFAAARRSPLFQPGRFVLILGSWNGVPWWTGQELANASGIDSVAVAPYLFNEFNDARSTEAVFGPMFAQPEQLDSRPDGSVAQQAAAARVSRPAVGLAVYEVNLGSMSGSVPQSALDAAVPSIGAGLAVADHMLLMLRDLGVTTQAMFCLPEYRNDFTVTGSSASGQKQTMPLWGAVVDMGGQTDLRRPQFLALAMINAALLPHMLHTTVTGPDPTWNQPASPNDKIELRGAHLLQSFAFSDGARRSLILLNLSRAEALPVAFAGPDAPRGQVTEELLTAAHITDSNELTQTVSTRKRSLAAFHPAAPYTLPPFSITTLTWTIR